MAISDTTNDTCAISPSVLMDSMAWRATGAPWERAAIPMSIPKEPKRVRVRGRSQSNFSGAHFASEAHASGGGSILNSVHIT